MADNLEMRGKRTGMQAVARGFELLIAVLEFHHEC